MTRSRSTPTRHPARAVLLPTLVAALAACTDAAPTQPEGLPDVAAAPVVQLALAPEESAGLLAALEDVQTRVLPTLENRATAKALDAALGSLAASLIADEGTAVRRALAESRRALATLRAHPDARQAAAELDAVELVLDRTPELRN